MPVKYSTYNKPDDVLTLYRNDNSKSPSTAVTVRENTLEITVTKAG